MTFYTANKDKIAKDNPELSTMPEIGKKAGEMWRNLSDEDKLEWKQQGQRDYEKKLEEWKQSHPSKSVYNSKFFFNRSCLFFIDQCTMA